ncbi:MAG TPA: DUF3142 domain-containing protein [Verrucomicrobiae bacterium]
MKNRFVVLSALLVAAVAIAALLFSFNWPGRRTSGPLRHEVYVWQRAWTQPVREAVAQRATNFAEVVPLQAEITWTDKKPELARVAVDYPTLAKSGRPIGLALRIGPYPGPFVPLTSRSSGRESAPSTKSEVRSLKPEADQSRLTSAATVRREQDGVTANGEDVTAYLCDIAASLVAEARNNGVSPAELQLDFDCATSKLDGYRIWLEAIQRRVAPLPVTITALPSWLRSSAFKRLAQTAPNYVLQVHSVERPASFDAPFSLCDPADAHSAVERAGRLGVPFRVALPTYGYMFAFATNGQFLGLSAEGPRRNWPAGARLREVSSNPIELAALLQGWTADRPAAMRGVIWYRLPVAVDNFNWRWPTLGAMLAARVPRESFRAGTRRVEAGLVEISLVNEGELDISSRLAVEARWSGARLVSGDGQRGFQLVDGGSSAASFQTQNQPSRLRAGESIVVGWLRFDRDCEVKCEARKLVGGER